MRKIVTLLTFILLIQGAQLMAGIGDLFVYFPSKQVFDDCPTDFDAQTVDEGERPLRYYEKIGHSASKVILYFHGNAGSACDRLPLVSGFDDPSRYHFVFAEYSGYSKDSGPRNEETFTSDALRLYDHISQETDLPITVFGRSLGSTVATFLASQRSVDGLILVSPLTSIIEVGRLYYPFPKSIIKRLLKHHSFDATQWAPDVKSPVLIIQGDQDKIVPLKMAKEQARKFTSTEVRFEEVTDAGHNDIASFESYSRGLNDYLMQE